MDTQEVGGSADDESTTPPLFSSPLSSPVQISECALLSLWLIMKYSLHSTLAFSPDSHQASSSHTSSSSHHPKASAASDSTSSRLSSSSASLSSKFISSPLVYESLRSLLFHPLQIERDFRRNPLHISAICGDLSLTYCLLMENLKSPVLSAAAKDTLGNTPLHYLAATGVSCPCSPSHSHLSSACSLETPLRASHLLPPDMENISAHVAYFQIRVEDYNWMMKRLVLEGCAINEKNNFGQTPLHFACRFRNIDAVRWLLQEGADPNCTFTSHSSSIYSLDGIGGEDMLSSKETSQNIKTQRRPSLVSPLSLSLSTSCSRISKNDSRVCFLPSLTLLSSKAGLLLESNAQWPASRDWIDLEGIEIFPF